MFFFNQPPSRLEEILSKEEITLEEVLGEDDVIQECRAENSKLMAFLTTEDTFQRLLAMVLEEPDETLEMESRFRMPNKACDVLTIDVGPLNDRLFDNFDIYNRICDFVRDKETLNPLLISYYTRVVQMFFYKQTKTLIEYFAETSVTYLGDICSHLYSSAVSDLIFKFATASEVVDPSIVQTWLDDHDLSKCLIATLADGSDAHRQDNASNLLIELMRYSEMTGSPCITEEPNRFVTTVTLNHLDSLLALLDSDSIDAVSGCLSILQTVLVINREHGGDRAVSVVKACAGVMDKLNTILTTPPKQTYRNVTLTFGTLDPPLGKIRIQTSSLIFLCMQDSRYSVEISHSIIASGVIASILELFQRYTWNSFLHAKMRDIVETIISECYEDDTAERPLLAHLLDDLKFPEVIITCWDANTNDESAGKSRRGYMGHLINMANSLVIAAGDRNGGEFVSALLSKHQDWEYFVSNTLLAANEANKVDHRPQTSSSDDTFTIEPFDSNKMMQEMFKDYKDQKLTTDFIRQFGVDEDPVVTENFCEMVERKLSSTHQLTAASDEPERDVEAEFESLADTSRDLPTQLLNNDSSEIAWEDAEINEEDGSFGRGGDDSDSDSSSGSSSPPLRIKQGRGGSDEDPFSSLRGNDASASAQIASLDTVWNEANVWEPAVEGSGESTSDPFASPDAFAASKESDDEAASWAAFPTAEATTASPGGDWADFASAEPRPNEAGDKMNSESPACGEAMDVS